MNNKFLITIYTLFLSIILFSSVLNAQDNSEFKMIPIQPEAFKVMSDFLNYDKGIPLNPRIASTNEETDYTIEKIIFQGTHDDRVPGYMAIPKNGTKPYPCVILLHGFGGSKESWWDGERVSLTTELLKSGYAVLTLDAQYLGERMANNDYERVTTFAFRKKWHSRLRDMQGQTIKDHRRAIDYLNTRPEIDSSRIGMVGYSNGAMMTFNLAAIDSRIKVAVASVAPLIHKQYSVLNIINFAPYITKQPFLMLMANKDRNYTVEEAQTVYNFISSKDKDIVFYESEHQLPIEWITRAKEWLDKYL